MKLVVTLAAAAILLQAWAEHRVHRQRSHHRRKCSTCPPGSGLLHPCTAHKDTECSPCPPGTYSPRDSAVAGCWICSRCGAGLFESHPCTPEADTTCDSCLTARPRPLGADFDRKCLFGRMPPPPPPPPLPPGGGQTVAHRRALNGSADHEDREADNISTLTLGVASIAVFQITVCVAAAAGVCQYARRTQSCLVDDMKESASQEANPLMEVAVPK